jgi:hypothetical protein
MFENAIWKNPIGWTNRVVGTQFAFFALVILHIIAPILLLSIPIILFAKLGLPYLSLIAIACVMLIPALILPLSYLYALKTAIRELKEKR